MVIEDCIDCHCDALDIYDGGDDTAPILETLCGGGEIPDVITASGSEMFIRFRSDDSVEFAGFQATVSEMDTGQYS